MIHKLRTLFIGRNGFDQLSFALIVIAMVLNIFVRIFFILPLIIPVAALVGLAVFRTFSRNISKRREENYRFVRIWGDIRTALSSWKCKRAEKRVYKYFNCPDCKSRLRVHRGKGKIQITCPRCGLRFKAKS